MQRASVLFVERRHNYLINSNFSLPRSVASLSGHQSVIIIKLVARHRNPSETSRLPCIMQKL